jgi:hypothetical protein
LTWGDIELFQKKAVINRAKSMTNARRANLSPPVGCGGQHSFKPQTRQFA